MQRQRQQKALRQDSPAQQAGDGQPAAAAAAAAGLKRQERRRRRGGGEAAAADVAGNRNAGPGLLGKRGEESTEQAALPCLPACLHAGLPHCLGRRQRGGEGGKDHRRRLRHADGERLSVLSPHLGTG